MAFIPYYILILFALILIDYYAGLLIEKASGNRRKFYLIISLAANIGMLAFFKYYDFFVDNLNSLLSIGGGAASLPLLRIILPIGLSFHTFQAMSYTIEVYRGTYPAERHFGIYALYVMFYPQLVAGPIERPQNILPQLHEEKIFDYDNVASGLRLMAWGLFKKVVIADRLAAMVNEVYGHPEQFRGLPLLVATGFFSFQIYCDFSGYSDMARGAARVMGFKLMLNFDRPYFAQSIGEFWRRWHISLSTWFKDYVYIPLGGNRVSVPRNYLNLLLIFLLSGLWHGPSWTFVMWGALHGSYLIMAHLTVNLRTSLIKRLHLPALNHPLVSIFFTFGLVTFAWIFFRANNLSDAFYIVRHLADNAESLRHGATWYGLETVSSFYTMGEWLALAGALAILLLVENSQRRVAVGAWLTRQAAPVRWSLYYGIVGYIALLGAFKELKFIYFQF
nr:MBOAT family O-acyltransferase [Hymenobacter jeongseonensis]